MLKKLAILLGIFLFLLPLTISAQIATEPTNCIDKCENGILYQKGILDSKTKQCVYGIQQACKYGCIDSKISTKPECALYPATLPDNDTQARDIIFQIVKEMYEREKIFGHISLFGTEYVLGQNGTLFLKLLDSNELPINNGFCSITVYYPNKTIKFMDNTPTTFLENGLYYKDFFVPDTEGLYIADATCIYADTVFRYNIPSEDAGYDGAIGGGTSPQPLVFKDIDCTEFHTLGGGTYQNWTFNYTSLGLINLSAITQIDFNWVGQISAANGFIQAYNWNTSAWVSIGTSVASTGITLSCGNNVYLSRSTTSNFTSYIRNNTIMMRLYRAGTATMLTDAVEIIFHNNGSVVANLRGSSEVHVSNFFNQTSNLTVNINQSQLNSLLSAINSVNATANETLSYAAAINGSVFNLSQAEFSHFQQLLALLNSINYTLNTTLEYKLDLINGTVQQINQSQLSDYLSLLGAIENVNITLNGSIIPYLVVINDTTYQINQSQFQNYLSLLQAINSVNFTVNTTIEEKIDYLNSTIIPLLLAINQTGNTTLELVASINQTLWDDIFVILKDINYTTNTTLEYKLDLINYTTWDTWLIIQNLTVGNVSVTANINWTQGLDYIWNASSPQKINYDFLSYSDEGIELVAENYLCLDNSTLQIGMNITKCFQGICNTINQTTTQICSWGCANNQCLPAPTFQYMYAVGFVLILFGLIYVMWKVGK
jgi:hypothetical protein